MYLVLFMTVYDPINTAKLSEVWFDYIFDMKTNLNSTFLVPQT